MSLQYNLAHSNDNFPLSISSWELETESHHTDPTEYSMFLHQLYMCKEQLLFSNLHKEILIEGCVVLLESVKYETKITVTVINFCHQMRPPNTFNDATITFSGRPPKTVRKLSGEKRKVKIHNKKL